jgi:hypothetical protein
LAQLDAVVVGPRERRRGPTAARRHSFASGIIQYSLRLSLGEQLCIALSEGTHNRPVTLSLSPAFALSWRLNSSTHFDSKDEHRNFFTSFHAVVL